MWDPVADPRFPRGGVRQLQRWGHQPIILANFSQKLHKIEEIWTVGASLVPPLDPPMDQDEAINSRFLRKTGFSGNGEPIISEDFYMLEIDDQKKISSMIFKPKYCSASITLPTYKFSILTEMCFYHDHPTYLRRFPEEISIDILTITIAVIAYNPLINPLIYHNLLNMRQNVSK